MFPFAGRGEFWPIPGRKHKYTSLKVRSSDFSSLRVVNSATHASKLYDQLLLLLRIFTFENSSLKIKIIFMGKKLGSKG